MTKIDKKTTIIIPNKNGLKYLKILLPILKKEDCEILVVDNASTDKSVKYCYRQEVNVYNTGGNKCFAEACNLGVANSPNTPYLLFLNNDTKPKKGFLKHMEKILDTKKNVWVVGAKIIFLKNVIRHVYFSGMINHVFAIKGTLQHAGVEFNRDFLPFEFGRNADPKEPELNVQRVVPAVTGCCMLVRRNKFEELDGFDDGYKNGWEDNDFCLKVLEASGLCIYEPLAVIGHYFAGTKGRFGNEDVNFNRFLKKWHTTERIFRLLKFKRKAGKDEQIKN